MSGDMSGTSDLANQLLKLSRILAMSKKHGMTYAVWDRDISNTEAAATALEAKEAEIAALKELVYGPTGQTWKSHCTSMAAKEAATQCRLVKAEARAETAERELVEARAALKANGCRCR